MHDMAKKMRIMNENNTRLIQHLTTANPLPPATHPVPDIQRSLQSGDDNSQNNSSTGQAQNRRRRSPSLSPLCYRSSSSESESSSRTPEMEGEELQWRGRSSHRDDWAPRRRDHSTSQKIRDQDSRLDAINTGVGVLVTIDVLIKQTEPPFTRRVMRARVSSKFKLPTQLGGYERKTDPMDHLDSYKSLMPLQGCSNKVMCKAFFATLKGPARS